MVGAMTDLAQFLAQPLAQIGATVVTLGQSLAFLAGLLLFLLARWRSSLWRSASARAYAAADAAEHARETDARMAGILQAQAEMQGRMSAVADVLRRPPGRTQPVDRPAARRHDRPHRPDDGRTDQIDA